MSASKIVRNSGSLKTVEYGGRAWEFPGGGDTTMVPGEVADFVEQHCFREGLQIVHPEAEAAERERLAAPEATAAPAEAVEPEPVADEPKTESEAQPDPPAAPAPPVKAATPKPAKKAAKKKG